MNGGSILVLDDNEDNQKLVLHYLKAKGYAARGVGTTREADEAIEETRPALALVDVALPQEDGLRWIERTRGRPGAPAHFIVVTAHAEPGARDRARLAGCVDYLTKPVALKSLLAAVQACLGGAAGGT